MYFRGTGERIPNLTGTRNDTIASREYKKTILFFFIFGDQGNKPICFNGTDTLALLGGPHYYLPRTAADRNFFLLIPKCPLPL